MRKIGEEELEFWVHLWRWQVWASEPEPPAESTLAVSSEGSAVPPAAEQPETATPAPARPTPSPVPPSPSAMETPSPLAEPSIQPLVPPAPLRPKTDSHRPLFALALHPRLEGEAWRLLLRMMRNVWRIFRIRIPELRVHYGLGNPAQMGWIAGGLWSLHGMSDAPEGWEFVPAWDKPGLAALQSEVRITITVFRMVRFFASSFFAVARFTWVGWRLYKAYKADPAMAELSSWRRYILQRLAPLIEEVQNDKA